MKSDIDPDDEIEVVDEKHGLYGRIRIRERQGKDRAGIVKVSIFLTPRQLEEHAAQCIALAAAMKDRR